MCRMSGTTGRTRTNIRDDSDRRGSTFPAVFPIKEPDSSSATVRQFAYGHTEVSASWMIATTDLHGAAGLRPVRRTLNSRRTRRSSPMYPILPSEGPEITGGPPLPPLRLPLHGRRVPAAAGYTPLRKDLPAAHGLPRHQNLREKRGVPLPFTRSSAGMI